MSEVTFKTGEVPICPFCELKHVSDAKYQSEGSRKKRLAQIQKELAKITGTPLKTYEEIRKVEHKVEDYQSYLRSQRHKVEDSIDNPVHLTDCEKRFPTVQHKLNICMQNKSMEECRADIKCPPKGNFIELPKDIIVRYDDRVRVGENLVSLNEPIEVVLHPKLKKNPKLHDIVLQHESIEGVCNYESAQSCHNLASILGGKEEEEARKVLK